MVLRHNHLISSNLCVFLEISSKKSWVAYSWSTSVAQSSTIALSATRILQTRANWYRLGEKIINYYCFGILRKYLPKNPSRFTGSTGRAYLFKKVVNLTFSNVQDRVMLTGRHMVRDVMCKQCKSKLGWMYEFALEESQKYKEGKVILEHALISESEGFNENRLIRNHDDI